MMLFCLLQEVFRSEWKTNWQNCQIVGSKKSCQIKQRIQPKTDRCGINKTALSTSPLDGRNHSSTSGHLTSTYLIAEVFTIFTSGGICIIDGSGSAKSIFVRARV